MKIATLLLILGISMQSHALVTSGFEDTCWDPLFCTALTTSGLPTLIVMDATGEEVWNSDDEELLAQYEAELNGSAEIYAIKRYADIRTAGNVEAAKVEIRKNLQQIKNKKDK
ncbi:MAG: hypothetical protein ACXVCP_02635 [Bdellovibrio sp.]